MVRKINTEAISLYVSSQLKKALEEKADAKNIGLSALAREILTDYINQNTTK